MAAHLTHLHSALTGAARSSNAGNRVSEDTYVRPAQCYPERRMAPSGLRSASRETFRELGRLNSAMGKLHERSAGLGRLVFYALMAVGCWFLLTASTSYWELGAEHPFFLEKLPLAQPKLWLTVLYVHVPSALLALPACLILLVKQVRNRWPRFHRWLGRLTGALVLFAVVPSGMYLALFAQGGMVSTLGFWLTGLITFVAMLKSIQNARAGNMRAHRRYSSHVAAQLAVAVVSRFLLIGAELLGRYDEWTYVAALWIPVLGCALVAELMTGHLLFLISKGSRHEKLAAVPRLDPVR